MKVKMILIVAVVTIALAIIPNAASAHVLDGVYGVFAQLGHQLLGVHHLPLSLLAVAVGVLIFRRWKKRAS